MNKNKFPDNFYWGASTSAYQCEGGWNEDGKTPGINDIIENTPQNSEISDFKIASDHYHRWKEDVALMAEMGLKMYRFSISWPRINPAQGVYNEKGLKFYDDLIDELKKNNIEPLVTMFHFDTPIWLQDMGGWANRIAIDEYYKYCEVLLKRYSKKVKYWQTINEQNMYVLAAAVISKTPTQAKDAWQGNHHMNLGQVKVIKLCHQITDCKIGPAPNISAVYHETSNPEDKIAAQTLDAIRNWMFLDPLCYGRYNSLAVNYLKSKDLMFKIEKGDLELLKDPMSRPDFIANNYYCSTTVRKPNDEDLKIEKTGDQHNIKSSFGAFAQTKNKFLKTTQFGWEIDPIGFRITLRDVWDRYHLPIVITECGIGCREKLDKDGKIHDQYRIDFYESYLKELAITINEGVEVFGFNPWSCFDLVSTHEGMEKRYGFIYVDRGEFDLRTLNRYKKDSFFWYKELIKNNGSNL
ncbi:glycoside hydrolase family 1 protein [Spiroplasma endosymbiont of Aspidapion aeneum]|uniref:glycoside hydrolase family 1 protein n=1 Tax=Spiroplasma endosymbiont of Aspidapion aeneum TaxID=3066276 RepID=UPI00313BB695